MYELVGLLSALVMVTVVASASAKGGYGSVTFERIGALRVGVSGPVDVRRYAGTPDRISRFSGGNGDVEDYSYNFPHAGSVQYYLTNPAGRWVLDGFESTLQRFHTTRGTRPGMSLRQAQRHEGNLRLSSECGIPALVRSSRSMVLGIWLRGSGVSELFLIGPDPFAFC